MRRYLASTIGLASLALPSAGMAHHSFAMFDRTKEIELKQAVVARWEWTNPHIWLDVVVPTGGGRTEKLSIEGGSTGLLRRQGWEKNALKPGDKITVYFSPLKSGEPGGSLLAVVLSNGKVLGARLDQQKAAE